MLKPLKQKGGIAAEFVGAKFEYLQMLGSGSYGDVYQVRHKQTKKIYAVKKYKKIFTNRVLALRTLREVMILRKINHERIIKIYDILPPPDIDNYDSLGVVLEYQEFDLKKLFRKNLFLKDEHVPKIIYQLLIALKYLKSMKVLHRDLKPENILSDNNFNIKICDFGLARPGVDQGDFTMLSQERSNKLMTCHVVSRWYRAPELILMQTKYDSSIEMWAVGCILGQLVSEHEKNKKIIVTQPRKALFAGKACFPLSPPKQEEAKLYTLKNGFPYSEDDQISKILQVIGSPTEEEVSFIEEALATNYIRSLPKYNKKKPSEIFDYCKPQWEDFLEKTLVFDPRKRMTIDEAIQHPLLDGIRNENDFKFQNMEDLDLFLPSELSMEEIKEKLKEEILLYKNGIVIDEEK